MGPFLFYFALNFRKNELRKENSSLQVGRKHPLRGQDARTSALPRPQRGWMPWCCSTKL